MAKDGITITGADLYAGMADSRYFGIADIRNLDITSTPGAVTISPRMTKESGTVVTNLIKHWAKNPITGDVYAVDNAGQAYKRSSAGAWSTISGFIGSSVLGCAIYKDYFYVACNSGSNTAIQKYGPLSSTPSWSSAVINTGNLTNENCPMLVSPADILYIGTNQYVAQIAGSTITEGVLVIPSKYNISTLSQIGTRVYAGVSNSENNSLLFPWNRVDINPDIPIPMNGVGVKQAKAVGNLIYAHCGLGGTINVTNGASVSEIKRINAFNAYPVAPFSVNPNAIDSFNGGLLIGIGKTATADDQSPVGIFYYKDKGEKYKAWQYFIPSHGLDGSGGQVCQIGAVLALSDTQFIASWYDGTNYGVDIFDTSRVYTGYSAWFTSPLYNTGGVVDQQAKLRVEFAFAKDLEPEHGIKIQYRSQTDEDWTDLGTWDGTTKPGSSEGYFSFGHSKTKLQLKVSLTGSSSTNHTPELLWISIK